MTSRIRVPGLIGSRVRRGLLIVAAVALLAPSCSSSMSLTEYATEGEALILDMNRRLNELYAEAREVDSLEGTKRYIADRVQLRHDFLDSLRELSPPDDAAELHEAAIAAIDRLASAEAALSDRVQHIDTYISVDAIWALPEAAAARVADEAAIELCRSAQSDLDRTQLREEFGDVPWVPPQMKEVVLVALRCVNEG